MENIRHFNHNRIQNRFYGKKGKFSYHAVFYFQRQDYFKLDERLKGPDYQRFDVKSHRDDWGAILHLRLTGKYHDLVIGGEFKTEVLTEVTIMSLRQTKC